MTAFQLVPARKDWRERIFTVLKLETHAIAGNRIARKLGWERANDKLYKYLEKLTSEGKLVCPIPGLYMLPKE